LQITRGKPRLGVALAAVAFIVCITEVRSQMKDAGEIVRRTSPQLIIANKLQDLYLSDANIRILCDDPVVAALSEIPPERISNSSNLPAEPQLILADLDKREIDYIVYRKDDQGSPVSRFAELQSGIRDEHFELVAPAFATDWHGSVFLYRLLKPGQQK
jgi:hypothetical protein